MCRELCENNSLACKFLKIAKYIRKVFIPGGSNQMNMIAHNTPTVHQQTLFRLTESQTFNQDISVLFSREHVYPPDSYRDSHSKSHKMNFLPIPDLVATI